MTGFTSPNVKTLQLDVSSDESVNEAIERVIKEEGRLDIVVSNAGAMALGPLLDMTTADVQHAFDTNYLGTHRLVRAAVPHMAARHSGRVIIVGSIVGLIPGPWHGTYSASKAALHNYAEVLHMECAPFGVKVQLVIPGSVKSNISKNEQGRFAMREGSLYMSYAPALYKRLVASQGSTAMPTDKFAAEMVKQALKKEPRQHVMLGGLVWAFYIFGFLPRSWVLRLFWNLQSK